MTRIILCNRLGPLKANLRGLTGPFRYINLLETRESLRICDYLRERPDAFELARAQLFRERSDDFRGEFIEFMGRLNVSNHSLDWWAMPFTDKFPLASNLYQDAFSFLLIVDLLRRDGRPLVVVTDSEDLKAQVKVWAIAESINIEGSVRPSQPLRQLIKRYTPAGLAYAACRTFAYWLLSRGLKPPRNLIDEHLVITTLTHERSYSGIENGYRDAYFGDLVEQLEFQRGKTVIFCLMLGQPLEQLKKLKSLRFNLPVVPIESCLTLTSIVVCTFRAFLLYVLPVRFKGPIEINGLDLSCLVKRSIAAARHSGNLFMNLRIYYSARGLGRILRIGKCIYPYENLAREKMLVLGVRSADPDAHFIGYQHAAISQAHANFFLGKDEAQVTPLPKVILTTGAVTKARLKNLGNYPAGIFKKACALRQSQSGHTLKQHGSQGIKNVLVTLGSIGEYVGILTFLGEAFSGLNGFELRIRPHPLRTLESALTVAPLSRKDFFSESTGSLDEDLEWADIVLYSSSTVALEAIALGVPLIYLDLGDYVDTDPMLDWSDFKWSAKEPSQLLPIIQSIDDLPNGRFIELQNKGKEYMSSYLEPVSAAGMRTFLDA